MGSSKSMSGCIEVGHTALAFHSFGGDNIKAKTGQNRNNNKTAIKTSRKGRRIATLPRLNDQRVVHATTVSERGCKIASNKVKKGYRTVLWA